MAAGLQVLSKTRADIILRIETFSARRIAFGIASFSGVIVQLNHRKNSECIALLPFKIFSVKPRANFFSERFVHSDLHFPHQ